MNIISIFCRSNDIKFFHPSSIAVSEKNFSEQEYKLSKKFQETVLKELENIYENWSFFAPRLPRYETDQTLSVSPIRNTPPVEIICYLRSFQNDHNET